MTQNSEKGSIWSGRCSSLYERNTSVGDEVCEVIVFITRPMALFVSVVPQCVIVKFGVVQKSFPSFPANWDPAPVVLVEIFTKVAWERRRTTVL